MESISDIKAIDLDPETNRKLAEYVVKGLEISKNEKQLANYIKNELDKHAGVGWNVAVGRNFGSNIVHQVNKYVFFSVKEISFLVWKP